MTALRSPLWMVTQDPAVHALVTYLQRASAEIMSGHRRPYPLSFSRSQVAAARHGFNATICQGEARLHRLSGLLADAFFEDEWDLSSVVIGRVRQTDERFTLVRGITTDELYSQTDLDLGTRQLKRLSFQTPEGWSQALLVASFVEYEPKGPNRHGVYKLTSRIKAEQEIWNKVVDEIFAIDQLVTSDKQLRHLSRYVKDLFGLKILVGDEAAARRLHGHLTTWVWTPEELAGFDIPYSPQTRRPEFLEVKDYLSGDQKKGSGWQAMKSVIRWWEQTFEIQIQPLRNYFRERERLTRESHSGFKARREELRDQVARALPLFGYYRSLLRWLFAEPGSPPPQYEGVTLELKD